MEPQAALNISLLILLWMITKASAIAAALWFAFAWPNVALRMQDVYESRPGRCTLVGIVNIALALIITAALLNTQPVAWLGLLIAASLAMIAFLSYTMAYRLTAGRLETQGGVVFDSEASRIAAGGLAAEILFMTPVLGQVLSVYALTRGVGAMVLALLGRHAPRVES